jgi:hypothetical protein
MVYNVRKWKVNMARTWLGLDSARRARPWAMASYVRRRMVLGPFRSFHSSHLARDRFDLAMKRRDWERCSASTLLQLQCCGCLCLKICWLFRIVDSLINYSIPMLPPIARSLHIPVTSALASHKLWEMRNMRNAVAWTVCTDPQIFEVKVLRCSRGQAWGQGCWKKLGPAKKKRFCSVFLRLNKTPNSFQTRSAAWVPTLGY